MHKDPQDYRRFKECFDRNDSPRALDKVEWQYDTGFADELLVNVAVEPTPTDEEIAAIYAVFPVPFSLQGQAVKAAQSLDTMTDTRHQGKGLFKKLAQQVYTRCREGNYRLVYGFPNGNSAYAFFNRLGWKEVAEVPFMIAPLRTKYFLQRLPVLKHLAAVLPDIQWRGKKSVPSVYKEGIRPIERFDEQAETLWKKFAANIPLAVTRNAQYLNWRFLQKPGEKYEMRGYWEKGVLTGYVIYVVKEKHGGRIGYLMELITDPAQPACGDALLRTALNDMVAQKADACLAWNFAHSPNNALHKQNGFYPMPPKLRPIELHFGVLAMQAEDEPLLAEEKNWYLSYCDSDTV
ncbi:GNAT family N-acetyltransferase [Hymenobacter swuensis]|uniref:Uncharacterized protein n=1 Tax=Hymenobacter swuensis DY53 TaxID=1227739 RepID=W8EV90_9BACT|nr:GNAT family N-acetyltransferase [Hymenobacter swuensis]AHJ96418.1 hypothetical protein Hsw_0823 [Hymenobacter swuensis DY53]